MNRSVLHLPEFTPSVEPPREIAHQVYARGQIAYRKPILSENLSWSDTTRINDFCERNGSIPNFYSNLLPRDTIPTNASDLTSNGTGNELPDCETIEDVENFTPVELTGVSNTTYLLRNFPWSDRASARKNDINSEKITYRIWRGPVKFYHTQSHTRSKRCKSR